MTPSTTDLLDVTFDVRRVPGGSAAVQVLAIGGDFDVEFADVVMSCAGPALGSALLVVDLSRVRFLDCSALGTLIRLKHQARRHGGTLLVRDPSPAAHQVLDAFGLDLALDAVSAGGRAGRHPDRMPIPIPG